jgi:threonine dehydrogenase-like Zn-dependent dehydrogenase
MKLPMQRVRAAVLTAYKQPLEFRDYPAVENLQPGEALVRVEMCGICGTDVHLWQGEYPVPLPLILGHETVGRVEKLGLGLKRDWRGQPLEPGDRVTWGSSIVCGECYYCRVKRHPTRCITRKAYGISYCADQPPHLRGGYAEQIVLRAGTAIFRLPEGLSSEAVIGAGCALPTMVHGLERAPVSWSDMVVIQGSGPVGLAAIAVAREEGAAKIVVIGGPPLRLEMARRFGADATIDVAAVPSPADRLARVLDEIGPYGADVVMECTGNPAAFGEGIELCRDGGKYLVLGQSTDGGNVEVKPHNITRKQLQIIGGWGFEARHVDRALSLLERTSWKDLFAAEVSHRFPLREVNEALRTMKDRRSTKTVILP